MLQGWKNRTVECNYVSSNEIFLDYLCFNIMLQLMSCIVVFTVFQLHNFSSACYGRMIQSNQKNI